MILMVAVGERFAADGVVVSGRSSIDRALVTGESAPEAIVEGGAVLAGTINLDAPLQVKVTAAGEATAIAAIARLMEAASGNKSRYVRLADRASRLYAPAVHGLALLSFAGWIIAGAGVHQAMLIAVAVLIITCPCALGLAVPVSQVVASGALMRRGILIKDGSAIERRRSGYRIVRQDRNADTRPAGARLALRMGTGRSRHRPGARVGQPPSAVASPCRCDRGGWRPGRRRHQSCRGSGKGSFGAGRQACGAARPPGMAWAPRSWRKWSRHRLCIRPGKARLLHFNDALRPGGAEAVDRINALGLAPLLISGDREDAVRAIAEPLGMEWRSNLSPQCKYAIIEELQASGRRVLMVGDGLNDGPALKAAYVSIAPSSASDVWQSAADLLFLGDHLSPVPVAILAARRTMRVVRQNFWLAIGYNVLAVPLAIAGMVTPLIAALAMSASSLLVVGNALRLRTCAR